MNPWTKLAALFLPTRRSINNDDQGSVSKGGLFGGQQWVTGRGECQYRREDLRALPARKRLQAGKLAAGRHKPSPTALAYTAWTGGVAHFWFWTSPAEAESGAERRWIPESLLLPAPPVDGVRLLKLGRGFEAQFWQKGVLAGSQWWEDLPSNEAWLRFVRSVGLDTAALPDVPEPQQLPWSARPWGETGLPQRLAGLFDEKSLWLLVFAVLATALGWQVSSLLRWQAAGEELAARIEGTRSAVAPLLSAREEAEQAHAELERLQGLRTPNNDYVLMADVARRLPEGSTLSTWNRQAEKLQATVKGKEVDPRAFVTAFQSDARLADVAVTPLHSGAMQLTFTLPSAAMESADAAQAGGP